MVVLLGRDYTYCVVVSSPSASLHQHTLIFFLVVSILVVLLKSNPATLRVGNATTSSRSSPPSIIIGVR